MYVPVYISFHYSLKLEMDNFFNLSQNFSTDGQTKANLNAHPLKWGHKNTHKNKTKVTIQLTFLPTQTGMPMIIAGTAIPARRVIPTGAPTRVPSCHRIFFFRLHGFLPQNVQPDGLKKMERKS